jgi:flagellar M-ring protein FliF
VGTSTILQEIRRLWARTTPAQRIALAGTIGLAVIVAFISFNLAANPDYGVAFSGLRDEDAAAIVAKLKESKIPYQLGERGTIRVPRGQVEEVRLMAAAQGLGQKGSAGVGMDIFTQPHFGLTEFAEKVNYQRALEGELSRTIGQLDAVESARVHLVLPRPSLFTANRVDPSASIVIQTKPGRRLDPARLQGITELVASSVEGLKAENITLMDTAGNVLSERAAANDPLRQSDRRAEMQRNLESRIEEDVTTMLNRLLGSGKAVVRVGADLDWDQYEANTETFSPANRTPQVRTQRETTESAQGGMTPGGVPGADTSVPIYAGQADPRGTQNERRDVSTTYELSSTKERTVRSPGGIKRLSVAVALDSDVIADAAQVDAISKLVATAAGLDTTRGDVVTLTALPFASGADASPASAAEWARQGELILAIARIAAMVLGPLILLFVFRMILGRRRATAVQSGAPRPALASAQDLLRLQEPSLHARMPTREELERVRIEQEVADYARSDPAVVAQVIRTWLREDQGMA